MDKINQIKIGATLKEGLSGTLTKLTDEKFDGKHPNNINEGFNTSGIFFEWPKVGENFWIENFMTSTVTELLQDGMFRTMNSVYRLTEDENRK